MAVEVPRATTAKMKTRVARRQKLELSDRRPPLLRTELVFTPEAASIQDHPQVGGFITSDTTQSLGLV